MWIKLRSICGVIDTHDTYSDETGHRYYRTCTACVRYMSKNGVTQARKWYKFECPTYMIKVSDLSQFIRDKYVREKIIEIEINKKLLC